MNYLRKRWSLAAICLAACSGNPDPAPNVTPYSLPVTKSDTTTTCTLVPGNYQFTYSIVSDTCDIGPTPSETINVSPTGHVGGATGTPSGCVDSKPFVDYCTVQFTRDCYLSAAGDDMYLQAAYAVDFLSGTGVLNSTLTATYDGEVEEDCATSATVKMEKL